MDWMCRRPRGKRWIAAMPFDRMGSGRLTRGQGTSKGLCRMGRETIQSSRVGSANSPEIRMPVLTKGYRETPRWVRARRAGGP